MNLHYNRKYIQGPWGGGNQFTKAFSNKFENKFQDLDVILILGLDAENEFYSAEHLLNLKQHKNIKFIIRVNENDARKGTNHIDKRLINIFNQVDHVVFVSQWLQDYFATQGWNNPLKSSVIKNGVDRDIFKVGPKFNNGKVNLCIHHWSDNRKKGSDVYEQLDTYVGQNSDKFTLTYIGRTQSNFKNTKVIQPLFGKALGDELGRYDVYISASRWDPGPNHVLESLSCGLPTFVHKDGGGCCDFINNDSRFIYKDFNELIYKLNSSIPEQNVQLNSWEECIYNFDVLIKKVYSNDSRGNV